MSLELAVGGSLDESSRASAQGDPVRLIRRQFRRIVSERRARLSFGQRSWEALMPLRALSGCLKQLQLYGAAARKYSGRSLLWLLLDSYWLWARIGCWPAYYYRFGIYLPERRGKADRFLFSSETACLLLHVNDPADLFEANDKERFAAVCAKAALPHPRTIAYFRDGQCVRGDPESLPPTDLFVKETQGKSGEGLELWTFDQDRSRYIRDGESRTAADLFDHIAGLTGAYVVQRRLYNHPAMARYSNGTLNTIRVVTAKPFGQPPELLIATLRMPLRDRIIDNFGDGGIASPIDSETGCLGVAVFRDPRLPSSHHHPDTGHPITGEVVPFWEEARALALRAHEAFPNLASIGWDVAVTDEGLVLLEANPGWGVELVQITHGTPLGETRLPEILLSYPRIAAPG